MVFLVSLVLLLYYRTKAAGVLGKLRVYGRMSLTMYITQSMLGSFELYNWGLGLAKKLSITHSVFVALIIFAIQYAFACFWFGRHCQGPLEYLWKKATWLGGRREKQ